MRREYLQRPSTVVVVPDLTGDFSTGKLPRIAPGAITVTIERTPHPALRAEFESWSERLLALVLASEGCLGATMLRPARAGDPYQLVCRFVDVLHLRKWERSASRELMRQEGEHLVASERVTVTSGTEEFFNALGDVERPRGRVRQFIVDVAWVYPVALLSAVWLAPYLAKLEVVPRVLISTSVIGATSKWATGPVRRWWRRRRMLPQGAVTKGEPS